MYTRLLKRKDCSILLFGPRGTGKSTWIRQNYRDVPVYDLLNTNEVLRLSKEPATLYNELNHLPQGSFVVIDEVQKVPALLNEVHRLIEDKKLRFVLCGSSARKLKTGSTNLLAGRARLSKFFPFVSSEVHYNLNLNKVLQYGMLPDSYVSDDPRGYLRTYAETYLQEEIRYEGVLRNIGSFARFLEISARQNGQVTNISSIARDAQIARSTVQGYFNILIDTLIGMWLYPWKLKRSTKQVFHPKFYFFDTGVVRALSERISYPPLPEELGHLLETFILHELRSFLHYSTLEYPLYFWSSHYGTEVDFFCETKDGYLAIECKSSPRWDKKFQRGLKRLRNEFKPKEVKCFSIYTGERTVSLDNITVLPVLDFLKKLWNGEIIK